MKITIKGLDSAFKSFYAALDEAEEDIVEELQSIGESAVKFVRERHANDWQDQTGNLRSSVGYVILKDGQRIFGSTFAAVSGPKGDGARGAAQGQSYINEISQQFPRGYTLLLVAGMNYASYVEQIHGRDVLTGARLLAEELLNQLRNDSHA